MGDDAFKLLKMKNGNFYKIKTKNHKCHYLFELKNHFHVHYQVNPFMWKFIIRISIEMSMLFRILVGEWGSIKITIQRQWRFRS